MLFKYTKERKSDESGKMKWEKAGQRRAKKERGKEKSVS